MEKNLSEVKGLAKKVFNIHWYAGRISENGQNSLLIWNKGLIPKVIAKVVPNIDTLYVLDRKYDEKAMELAELYETRFGVNLALRYIN